MKILFDLGQNRKSNFHFVIKDINGKLIKETSLPVTFGLGKISKVSLEPRGKFLEKLLLSEWFIFQKSGVYKIECKLNSNIKSLDGTILQLPSEEMVEITIGQKDKEILKNLCMDLTNIALTGDSIAVRNEAVQALSYVNDEIAVSYLEKVIYCVNLDSGLKAIDGLGRIGNMESAKILVNLLTYKDKEIANRAKYELSELRERTTDRKIIALINKSIGTKKQKKSIVID